MTREEYISELYAQEDATLLAVRQSIVERGMPTISVAASVGKMLTMLVRMNGAQQVLEIGALGGYSGICLARGLGAEGGLVSLELEQAYADLAKSNLEAAGFGDRVEFRVGLALDSLAELEREGRRFDLFFIDADKDNYPNYLEYAIKLGNPGALILADNVFRGDRVLDPANQEDTIAAMREFNRKAAEDDRLESMILPMGDGVLVSRIK